MDRVNDNDQDDLTLHHFSGTFLGLADSQVNANYEVELGWLWSTEPIGPLSLK